MSRRDPLILLEDIMLAIQKIGRYTSQMDHDAFLREDLVIDGVARNLEIIGEAARQLPEEFRSVHPQIPWTQIAGLRNRMFTTTLVWTSKSSGRSSSTICPSLRCKSALFGAELNAQVAVLESELLS
jgi:uncharacterized protein with HEPN domain